jgi:acetyl-CoA carboxylase carboxyl transferase subunit alpha
MGIIDGIIPEPLGGAHRDPQGTAGVLKEVILENLKALSALSKEELLKSRYKRFRDIGATG